MGVPSVIEKRLIFTVADPRRRFVGVGLDCDDALRGNRRFRRTKTGWMLSVPRPDLNRVEYRLVTTTRNGWTQVGCDPGNPERVRTAFGERSVALMPGYVRPAWLRQATEAGDLTDLVHKDPALGELPVVVWSPKGLAADEPARLLVVHDGPEYVELASLAHYAAATIADGTIARFRMALMQPIERDEWYAANPAYVGASLAAVDEITAAFATEQPPVIMGASLGGLIATLIAFAGQPRFGGVFSQAGSFFQPRLDEQESSYPFFDRVTEAVEAIVADAPTDHPLTFGLTCGVLEENHVNNRAMAAALVSLGHTVIWGDVADLHNYTAFRDSLHPTLTEVLRSVWGARMTL